MGTSEGDKKLGKVVTLSRVHCGVHGEKATHDSHPIGASGSACCMARKDDAPLWGGNRTGEVGTSFPRTSMECAKGGGACNRTYPSLRAVVWCPSVLCVQISVTFSWRDHDLTLKKMLMRNSFSSTQKNCGVPTSLPAGRQGTQQVPETSWSRALSKGIPRRIEVCHMERKHATMEK